MAFEDAWAKIQAIEEGTKIPNWTFDKGMLGDSITIVAIESNKISYNVLGQPRPVYKRDFENIYDIWEEYVSHNFPRGEMCKLTRNSKYIISTFKYICLNNNQLP